MLSEQPVKFLVQSLKLCLLVVVVIVDCELVLQQIQESFMLYFGCLGRNARGNILPFLNVCSLDIVWGSFPYLVLMFDRVGCSTQL